MYMVIPQVLLIIFYFVFICLDIADCIFQIIVLVVETIAEDRVISQFIKIWFSICAYSYYKTYSYILLLLFSLSLSCILYILVVVRNSVICVAVLVWLKQYEWFKYFEVYIVILQILVIIFDYIVLFVLIFPIVPFGVIVFTIKTTVGYIVISQFITIQLIKYFWCVYIHTTIHTHIFC